MNVLDAIAGRRSIRRFKAESIPEEALRCILTAGMQAPSGKNAQPWRFTVVQGDAREEMVRVMRAGIAGAKAQNQEVGSSEYSALIMEHAPVTIFVTNPEGAPPWVPHSIPETIWDVVNLQSVGAAIENMALAALELSLGTLWICDVFYAYEELMHWLGEEGELIAALSVGYPDEHPLPRKRKSMEEVVRWIGTAQN